MSTDDYWPQYAGRIESCLHCERAERVEETFQRAAQRLIAVAEAILRDAQ